MHAVSLSHEYHHLVLLPAAKELHSRFSAIYFSLYNTGLHIEIKVHKLIHATQT